MFCCLFIFRLSPSSVSWAVSRCSFFSFYFCFSLSRAVELSIDARCFSQATAAAQVRFLMWTCWFVLVRKTGWSGPGLVWSGPVNTSVSAAEVDWPLFCVYSNGSSTGGLHFVLLTYAGFLLLKSLRVSEVKADFIPQPWLCYGNDNLWHVIEEQVIFTGNFSWLMVVKVMEVIALQHLLSFSDENSSHNFSSTSMCIGRSWCGHNPNVLRQH